MARFEIHGPDEHLLGIQAVEKYTGFAKRRIRAMIAEGRFPRPVYRARNADMWRAIDLAAWMHLQAVLSLPAEAETPDPGE